MLIFADKGLTYLATPKTGSTAIELALRPMADIVFARERKHLTAQRFRGRVAPFLAETFGIETETVALMREPVDQLRSWYRYRTRDEVAGAARSTAEISFDAFLEAVAAEEPPEFAQVGSQFGFLTDGEGALQVDHLFAYEQMEDFLDFLEARLGCDIELKRRNVSPRRDTPMSAQALAGLEAARADEFGLYRRLVAAGGYLSNG